MASERLILLTNDDGFQALGVRSLYRELQRLGKVVMVAPAEEQSAVGHGLTIHRPIRYEEHSPGIYWLTGTPVDCVVFALRRILPRRPDLVVSGINHGPNLGDDVHYSGTVAGAREAAFYGIPSFAVSLVSARREEFGPASVVAVNLIERLAGSGLVPGTFLNINVPHGVPSDFRLTRQGSKRIDSAIVEKEDPRGRSYYWIGLDRSDWVVENDTDYQAICDGVVSVTPLQRDQTDYRFLREVNRQECGEVGDGMILNELESKRVDGGK